MGEQLFRFVRSERGRDKLIHDGFMYTYHRENKSGIVYRCDQRKLCNSTITISKDKSEVLKEPGEHEDKPDWGRIKAKECVQKMKAAASTSREPTSSIVQRSVEGVTSETNMKLPKKSTLRRRIQEVRREYLPEEPKNLEELQEIAARFTKTKSGMRWLLFYDPEATEKMAIFTTDRHLKFLAKAKYWIMDGTFKSAPNVFAQLYAMHVNVKGQWFPVVQVLMQRKTKASYTTLLRILKEEANNRLNRRLHPTYVSTDYETAVMQAASAAFPGVTIAGCLFHLGQSFWRKAQNVGLMEEYKKEENEELRAQFRSLIALALVPTEDVEDAFNSLNDDVIDDLKIVYKYVEETYIKGRVRGRGRIRPQFPPALWNCYERTLGDLPRTTNTCEAWHRRLNTLMTKSHPSLYHALEQLQGIVAEMEQDMERLEGGHSPPKKKNKYVDLDTRVSRIVARYQEYKEDGELRQYLRAIGHALAGEY